jgi:azurin
MKRFPLPLSTLLTGLAIMSAITAYFSFTHKTPPEPTQEAGQASKNLNETQLHGGSLQRGLAQAQPEEYLEVETGADTPSYTQKDFTVHAGKVVSVTLRNQSTVNQEHNWVLVKPGTRENVQIEAERAGPTWEWIPQSSSILAFVPMTQPGQSQIVLFRAPKKPGDYPFLCTYPGHGNVMNGTLHVIS